MDAEALNPDPPTLKVVEDEASPAPVIEVVVQIDEVTIASGTFEAVPGQVGVIRFDADKLRAQLDQVKPKRQKPKIGVYRNLPAGLD